MCDAAPASRRDFTAGRPRWGQLYGIVAIGLGLLGGVDALGPEEPARTALRVVVVAGTFVVMAFWLRRQHAALDLHQWCRCAGQRTTVRVIASVTPMLGPVFEDEIDIPSYVPEEEDEPLAAAAPFTRR